MTTDTRQPRERGVCCLLCKEQTWNYDAICHRHEPTILHPVNTTVTPVFATTPAVRAGQRRNEGVTKTLEHLDNNRPRLAEATLKAAVEDQAHLLVSCDIEIPFRHQMFSVDVELWVLEAWSQIAARHQIGMLS